MIDFQFEEKEFEIYWANCGRNNTSAAARRLAWSIWLSSARVARPVNVAATAQYMSLEGRYNKALQDIKALRIKPSQDIEQVADLTERLNSVGRQLRDCRASRADSKRLLNEAIDHIIKSGKLPIEIKKAAL